MRYILTLLILTLMPMLASGNPAFIVEIDMQQTGKEFRIETLKIGSTPTIKAKLYENGVIYTNLSGWGSTFSIYTNTSDTSIWSFPHTNITSNVVQYDLDTIGIPKGRYRGQFVFTNATRTVSFGHIGRVTIQESPGTGSGTTNALTTPINFDLTTESGLIDGVTLTNLTLAGLSATLNDLNDVNSVTTPTAGHGLVYRAAGWTNEALTAASDTRLDNTTATNNVDMGGFYVTNAILDAADVTVGTLPLAALVDIGTNDMSSAAHAIYSAVAGADTRLDDTTATNAVNMGAFDITNSGDVNINGGNKLIIGSPTNTFSGFPMHIQGSTYARDLTTNQMDATIMNGTVYAGLLLNGEDSIIQLVSEDEGGHGSTILQQEINADGTFSHQWIQGSAAKTLNANVFYIGQSFTKSYDIAPTQAPLYITTNGTVILGGAISGGVENGGVLTKGVLRVQDWADDVADSGRIRVPNAEAITWESSPSSGTEPSLTMSATEALELVNVTGITLGSAVLSEAELEILDGATITTAETDTLSDGSNADSLHVHASAGVSSLVDADMANDALDADKIIGDSVDDDDLDMAAGGTGQSLTDPGADGIMLWDDSDSGTEWDFAAIGSGLTYDGTTLTAAGAGDSVSIDGVGVVDPDFVSTGDIDFIDTSNTITANILSGADYTSDTVTISNLTVQTSLAGLNTFTLSVSQLVVNAIDTLGAADMDYGSPDVLDHTFVTDGTGTGEIVLPAGAIDSTEILDATLDILDMDAGLTNTLGLADTALQSLSITDVGDANSALSTINFDDGEIMTFESLGDGDEFFAIYFETIDFTTDTLGLLISAKDNDDENYIPLLIRDDHDGALDELAKIDYAGTLTLAGNIELGDTADTTLARSAAGAVQVQGSQVILANTTTFEYLYVNAGAMIPQTTTGAEAKSANESTTSLVMFDSLGFATDEEQGAGFWVTFPEGWDEGTVQMKFHFTTLTGTPGTTGVKWDVRAKSYTDNDLMTTALAGTERTVTHTFVDEVVKDIILTAKLSTALTIEGATDGEPVYFEITRDVADAGDTFAQDAELLGVVIEYSRTIQTATAW